MAFQWGIGDVGSVQCHMTFMDKGDSTKIPGTLALGRYVCFKKKKTQLVKTDVCWLIFGKKNINPLLLGGDTGLYMGVWLYPFQSIYTGW